MSTESRYLLVPFEEFKDEVGRIRYRAKYRGEIDFEDFRALADALDRQTKDGFMLLEFMPPKSAEKAAKRENHLAALLAKPDVEEIYRTGEPLKPGQLARVRALTKALAMAQINTGEELVSALKVSARAMRAIEDQRRAK